MKKGKSISYFNNVSPESLGIDPEGITQFLDGVKKAGLEMHRFMILRHGKCCAKITWDPYKEESMHPVYSFSKSLTATAIGFARQEGLLSLDEKIVDLFPEDLPEHPSENLKKCTIHHLLTMSCGHETEPGFDGPDWKKTFLAKEFKYEPGTFYEYNTAGSNMLAAIVKKKTGQQVTEYLRSRLFDPLGIGEVFCSRLADEDETETGGGGMKLSLDDMAKFGQFMLQDGWWDDKCLLKDWYLKLAGTKQIETAGDRAGHIKDWAYGYGYQCWMCPYPGSFRADGAFGQFALIYPGLDLCIIINAATEQTQTMSDIINNCLLPAVNKSEGYDASKDAGLLPELYTVKNLPVLTGCRNPVFEHKLEQALYKKADPCASMEGIKRLVGGAGLHNIPDDGSIEQIRFSFAEYSVQIGFMENGQWKLLHAALDGRFQSSMIDGLEYAACARWRGLRRLELEIRRTDAMSGVRLILNFEGQELRFEADETLMTDGGLGMTERRMATFFEEEDLDAIVTEVSGNNPNAR